MQQERSFCTDYLSPGSDPQGKEGSQIIEEESGLLTFGEMVTPRDVAED